LTDQSPKEAAAPASLWSQRRAVFSVVAMAAAARATAGRRGMSCKQLPWIGDRRKTGAKPWVGFLIIHAAAS